MLCSLAKLEENKLETIKTLESELGIPLLAYSCHSLDAAEITAEQLEKIKRVEGELGLSLVAVNN